MPGWFGAIQGPQFLSIALTSAIAGVIVAAYAFRRSYGWEHILTDDVFRGLTLWLGLFSMFFLWLQLQQIIGGVFAPPMDLGAVVGATLVHPVYIYAMVVIGGGLVYIFAQALKPSIFSVRRSLVVSIFVLSATLVEKVLFVVEGLMYPTFSLYEAVPGTYFPSTIEMLSVVGTVAVVTLIFMLVAKVVPVVELHAIEAHGSGAVQTDGGEPQTDAGRGAAETAADDGTTSGVMGTDAGCEADEEVDG
ncbi:MAG: hypothetical protein PPP58_09320 [Natronomonas sp.]